MLYFAVNPSDFSELTADNEVERVSRLLNGLHKLLLQKGNLLKTVFSMANTTFLNKLSYGLV